jgi:hypothetical protein
VGRDYGVQEISVLKGFVMEPSELVSRDIPEYRSTRPASEPYIATRAEYA